MSPRGVPVAGLHERLFDAAEQLLVRDGPSALDSRSITSEAGCAKGVLHNHFGSLDGFLTAFAADRLRQLLKNATQLAARAGEGTVIGNLTTTAVSVFGSRSVAIASLLMSQPQLQSRVQEALAVEGSGGIEDLERTFTEYFAAEKELGRIKLHADAETLALMFVGALHHLFATGRSSPHDLDERVEKIAAVLVGINEQNADQRFRVSTP
ncbi:TetR/AcrR family transcriptional regulator [Sphaerisporangium perillae]|uniref:TetR/AcrR family transcriptional regulator n=1 Tax=Sphaerisporangium perillae TaxID=2935860 RepID=UPI00200C84EE|nr:TetR/AcrR family transcriptional regulator [Sphaerisporangium perillae]